MTVNKNRLQKISSSARKELLTQFNLSQEGALSNALVSHLDWLGTYNKDIESALERTRLHGLNDKLQSLRGHLKAIQKVFHSEPNALIYRLESRHGAKDGVYAHWFNLFQSIPKLLEDIENANHEVSRKRRRGRRREIGRDLVFRELSQVFDVVSIFTKKVNDSYEERCSSILCVAKLLGFPTIVEDWARRIIPKRRSYSINLDGQRLATLLLARRSFMKNSWGVYLKISEETRSNIQEFITQVADCART